MLAIGRNRKEDEGFGLEPGEANNGKRMLRIAGIVPAAGAIIALILTQDFSGLMAAFDQWSILFAILAVANIALAIATRKKADGNGQDGQWPSAPTASYIPTGPASL